MVSFIFSLSFSCHYHFVAVLLLLSSIVWRVCSKFCSDFFLIFCLISVIIFNDILCFRFVHLLFFVNFSCRFYLLNSSITNIQQQKQQIQILETELKEIDQQLNHVQQTSNNAITSSKNKNSRARTSLLHLCVLFLPQLLFLGMLLSTLATLHLSFY